MQDNTVDITLTAEQSKRLSALKEVYRQQSALAQKQEVKHRIVSIDRPYIRPIVRGKENKRVEFGVKVNNIQIDGISFIEHHSYEAFNEGVRLQDCIEYQQELTGIKVTGVGADTIYANNDNRRYCTENGMTTCFVRKGPKPKDEDADISTARRIIGTLRSTAMEGSFGNQKQHYGVGRIAARNSRSDVQADETKLSTQILLWRERQCHQDPDLDHTNRQSTADGDAEGAETPVELLRAGNNGQNYPDVLR